mmetsp:Transcript_18241/g.30647  ORF Transcript_18241/g.30647 Transcript_18241/m.30647 type:complete len:544 (+) Transcript_18241:275-1906(+)
MQEEQPNEIQLRDSGERPIFKLSVRLIDTYKHINKVYYEAKAQKLREQRDSARGGVHNDGYDDQNYDYILQGDEILKDRYILKHKMGKGSFGQVVCAYDRERKVEVAIKIIKSRKPFLIQARTEIDILNKVKEKDTHDESNIVRLLDHFMYRNHQCLVFEILSFNLYELLKNTKFRGVSLSLIRKFSRHLLKSLEFLSRSDVDIIHCDLKPENILLRHPRRSAIKLIDFGSSCYLNKRTYSYIQSRFYRSPEVLLGLPYTQKIDVWSLGCVVVEMHTGEPLFGGANQADQICRIVDVLGMPPIEMIRQSPERVRSQFFERVEDGVDIATLPLTCDMTCIVHDVEASTSSSAAVVGADTTAATTAPSSSSNSSSGGGSSGSSGGGGAYYVLKRPHRGDNIPKPRKLEEILGVYTGGPGGKRAGEADHSPQKYLEFLDFVKALLVYSPSERATPVQIATHPYMLQPPLQPPPPPAAAAADVGVNNNSAQQQVQEQPPAVAAATSTTTTSVANTEFAEIAGAVAVAASSSVHAPAATTTAAAAVVL